MGWAGGSRLMSDVIDAIQANVPDDETRKRIYVDIIKAFEGEDADTLSECEEEDPAYKSALMKLHPEWYEDEDGDTR